jgi:hypothetical protein
MSPRFGGLGWVGAILLMSVIATLAVINVSWWVELALWMFILVGPIEMLRVDAIRRSGRA